MGVDVDAQTDGDVWLEEGCQLIFPSNMNLDEVEGLALALLIARLSN